MSRHHHLHPEPPKTGKVRGGVCLLLVPCGWHRTRHLGAAALGAARCAKLGILRGISAAVGVHCPKPSLKDLGCSRPPPLGESLELPLGPFLGQCSVDIVQVSEVLCGCGARCKCLRCSGDVVQVSEVKCVCRAGLCERGVSA